MIRTPGAERLQTPDERGEDDLDATLRPRRLEEFVGQEALREQLGVSIAAAGGGRLDGHRQLLAHRGLADELLEPAGAQRAVELVVGEQRGGGLDAVGHPRAPRSALASSSSGVSPDAAASRRSASPGS